MIANLAPIGCEPDIQTLRGPRVALLACSTPFVTIAWKPVSPENGVVPLNEGQVIL